MRTGLDEDPGTGKIKLPKESGSAGGGGGGGGVWNLRADGALDTQDAERHKLPPLQSPGHRFS